MKLGRTTVFAISAMALSIGAAFAGEDSTHRYHGTGPEWHQPADLAVFNDADSSPESISEPAVIGNEPAPAHETIALVERTDTLTMYEPVYVPAPSAQPAPEPNVFAEPSSMSTPD